MQNSFRSAVVQDARPLGTLRAALDILDAATDPATIHQAVVAGAVLLTDAAGALLVVDASDGRQSETAYRAAGSALPADWQDEAMELAQKALRLRRLVATSKVVATPIQRAGEARGALAVVREATAPALDDDGQIAFSVYCAHAAASLDNARLRADHLRLRQEADDLVSVVAHDFKTPLTSIKGFAQLVTRRLGQGADGWLVEALRTIDDQASRLAQLADDLTLYSRIGSGRIQMKKRPGDLAALLRDCCAGARQVAGEREVALNLPDDLPQVPFDADRLRQVLLTLLDNALQCSTNGSQARVSARAMGDGVLLHVQDFGSGLTEAEQRSVFSPFSRSERAACQEGSGLELAIAKCIVEAHGGRIWVESAPGRGSTFSLFLPIDNPTS